MNTALKTQQDVQIPAEAGDLEGRLVIPENAIGVVAFAHGSGSSRHSPRNRAVAEGLHEQSLATLLFDLLTPEEHETDVETREFRFDIPRLADRLSQAVDWLSQQDETAGLPIGLFGASTGAAAALITAADRPEKVQAIVSRGGRPDLADQALPRVQAPTLLIVGGRDEQVLELNRQASQQMSAPAQIEVVAGATHLFEEPGKLEEVTRLAGEWFASKLAAS